MGRSTLGLIVGTSFVILFILVNNGTIKLPKSLSVNNVVQKATVDTAVQTQTQVKKSDIVWNFKLEKESDGIKSSQTSVNLEFKNKKYNAGVYEGGCAERSDLFPGEFSSVVCLWKGVGIELGIFNESGKLLLKKGTFKAGDTEAFPAYRGNFKTLLEL